MSRPGDPAGREAVTPGGGRRARGAQGAQRGSAPERSSRTVRAARGARVLARTRRSAEQPASRRRASDGDLAYQAAPAASSTSRRASTATVRALVRERTLVADRDRSPAARTDCGFGRTGEERAALCGTWASGESDARIGGGREGARRGAEQPADDGGGDGRGPLPAPDLHGLSRPSRLPRGSVGSRRGTEPTTTVVTVSMRRDRCGGFTATRESGPRVASLVRALANSRARGTQS